MSWSSSSCGHSAVEVSSHLKSVQRCTTAGSIFNPKLIGFRWISIKNMGFGQGMIIDQLIFCPCYLWESWFVNHESMIKDWLTMNKLFLNHESMINPWCFKMQHFHPPPETVTQSQVALCAACACTCCCSGAAVLNMFLPIFTKMGDWWLAQDDQNGRPPCTPIFYVRPFTVCLW